MKKAVGMVIGLLMVGSVVAQDCVSNTGNNAIVTVPKTIGDSAGIRDGDILKVQYGALCVGEAVYHMGTGQTGIAVTVWGDNTLTQEIDGIPQGTMLDYDLFRPSTNTTFEDVAVSYGLGDGIYEANNIEIVDGIVVNGTLSLELTKFDAKVKDFSATLNWETVTEEHTAGFEIQQKIDSTFQTIAYLPSAGFSDRPRTYSHTVSVLTPGKHQFRLKMIDLSGQFSLSEIVSINAEISGSYLLSEAYPNPFNSRSNVALTLRNSEHVTVDIYDVVGRRVRTIFSGDVQANKQTLVRFDAQGLASGMYLMNVRGESFSETRRLTLLR